MTAFTDAMREALRLTRGRESAAAAQRFAPLPGSVFHGEADRTVLSGNGDRVVQRLEQCFEAHGVALTRKTATGQTHTTTSFHAADGRLMIKHWLVKDVGHAWCGDEPGGSHTDPERPDASARLVSVLLTHSRNA